MAQSIHTPRHTAIIMDGNGRWAAARGLSRTAGHRAGAESLHRVLEAAPALGIRTLTIYAFSSDNWKRPETEVSGLMTLLAMHLRREAARCRRLGIRISMIGRRDRLPPAVLEAAAHAEQVTRGGSELHLRLAIDYSAREAILNAARTAAETGSEEFSCAFSSTIGEDVDLLIRTGGEQRLSDFLLWECAYAELVFTDRMWPDFDAADLASAVGIYGSRERRFGAVPATAHLGQLQIRDEAWIDDAWIDEARIAGNFRGDRWLR